MYALRQAGHPASASQRVHVALAQALPFVIERPSARRHKAELDARLAEVEEALALFSKRTVLIRDED